jgi:small subunit ribosomal protein S21
MKKFKYFNKHNKYTKDSGMTVTVRNNDVNGALRVLKKKLMNEGLFQELRERSFHQTRGEKRRKAKAAGKRRYERKIAKRKQELGY